VGRYHVTVTESQMCDRGHGMVMSQGVTSHSHNMWQRSQLMSSIETIRVKEHSHISNCIYSVENLMGALLSSLCQTLIKSSWLYSGLGVSSLTIIYISFHFSFGLTTQEYGKVSHDKCHTSQSHTQNVTGHVMSMGK